MYQNTKQIMILRENIMKCVQQQLIDEIEYYSLTNDIWTSRTMQSFMAFTLHYLSEDFEMIAFVLEDKSLQGSHTGNYIRLCLESSIVQKLRTCSKLLLEKFRACFKGLSIDILWVTFLDPRSQKMKHLSSTENATAMKIFVDEVVLLISKARHF